MQLYASDKAHTVMPGRNGRAQQTQSMTPHSTRGPFVLVLSAIGFVAFIVMAFSFGAVDDYPVKQPLEEQPYFRSKFVADPYSTYPKNTDRTLNRDGRDSSTTPKQQIQTEPKKQNHETEPEPAPKKASPTPNKPKEEKASGGSVDTEEKLNQAGDGEFYSSPFECKTLEKYDLLHVKSETVTPVNRSPKIEIVKKPSSHVLKLFIPDCGIFYMKISCRPPLTYFWGRQEWPEIVATFLDRALEYNFAYPAYGIVLPTSSLDKVSVREKCIFRHNGESVILGAIMRSEKFQNDKGWYMQNCQSKNEQFLRDLFKLAIFDYLMLNTDRHMSKNWFREGNKLVAADNGAWSFHDHTQLCDQDFYLHKMLYPVKVFADPKENGCPWLSSSTRPICKLANSVKDSKEIKDFLEATPSRWKNQMITNLSQDQWFQVMTEIGHHTEGTADELVSFILARNMDTCKTQLSTVGIKNSSSVHPLGIAKYIVYELEERYKLAQQTVRECLKSV